MVPKFETSRCEVGVVSCTRIGASSLPSPGAFVIVRALRSRRLTGSWIQPMLRLIRSEKCGNGREMGIDLDKKKVGSERLL